MSDDPNLSLPEIEAISLTEAAVILDRARQDKDPVEMAEALDNNLRIWTAIRTIAARDDTTLSAETRANLTRLADFVSTTTLSAGLAISDDTIGTLINVNLQISEGLLDGLKAPGSV